MREAYGDEVSLQVDPEESSVFFIDVPEEKPVHFPPGFLGGSIAKDRGAAVGAVRSPHILLATVEGAARRECSRK